MKYIKSSLYPLVQIFQQNTILDLKLFLYLTDLNIYIERGGGPTMAMTMIFHMSPVLISA